MTKTVREKLKKLAIDSEYKNSENLDKLVDQALKDLKELAPSVEEIEIDLVKLATDENGVGHPTDLMLMTVIKKVACKIHDLCRKKMRGSL